MRHSIIPCLISILISSTSFAQTHFTAKLTGEQENPAVTTSATGTGAFVLTDAGLEFTVTVEGLEFTAAHFHNGAVGVNGGVVRTITADFDGKTASGVWTSTDGEPLTDALIAEILAGNIYVNIHTAANGGGEIRGQVNLSAGTGFTAKLTGEQENPAVTTSATGTGAFTLTDAGLAFTVTVEGLEFTAAHFHNGAVGVNGGVVRTISGDFAGKTASGVWTSTDGEPLTDALIAELLTGNIYVNVHTAANAPGEIRGQVNLSAGTGFSAKLTGDQENPAVTTAATGTGVFLLTDAGLAFTVTVEGLEFTAAHFHNAAVGVNGGVVRTITADFAGKTASGVWTSTDGEPLTDALIAELLAGNIYVNVHTAANAPGEIRGQLNLSAGTGFSASLTGTQENPAVTTAATGTGAFLLTDAGLAFTVTVEGLDFTAAHFHNEAVGVNGGVVRTITGDFDGKTASGIWTSTDGEPLTNELIGELLAGNMYVNVHTAANAPGEIRGQLNLSAGTGFSASLTGAQENPAVTTAATGTGAFLLTDAGLAFTVTVEGLEFTAAHFHNEAIGVNGGVVRTITGDFDGKTASGVWTSTDGEPLTDALIAELLTGNIYVNVHTAANAPGEIRGQVNLSAGTGFSASLNGKQENPPVTTSASGTGAFTLTDAGLVFNATVEGLEFTAAHFHNAAVGVNGGVVRTITGDFAGKTASGVWMDTDSEPLTNELIGELLAGNMYVNVHTAANPPGEIRGQVNVGLPGMTPALPGVCYATLGARDPAGSLLTIDLTTGAGTLIGPTGITSGVPGLAIKSTGEMFANDMNDPGNLFRVDAATGAATLVGNTGLRFHAIAFDGNNQLWAAANNENLYTVDDATGASTLVGPLGANIHGLAFDPTTGILWGGEGGPPGTNDGIHTINTATGAATLVGNTGLGSNTPDVHFDAAGNLYGSIGGSMNPNDLISIDKATGVGTVIGSIGFRAVSGMAAQLDRIIVGIKGDEFLLPKEFALHQNYPNPFNPETSIQYTLPKKAEVRLAVFNLLGQKVAILVDENQAAGRYLVKWNGQDDFGTLVSSGIYIYKIEAEDFVQTKKMLLLK